MAKSYFPMKERVNKVLLHKIPFRKENSKKRGEATKLIHH